MKKSHVENTVGPWARQKLDGLEAYLHAYTVALKKQPFELVYIDAFAGATERIFVKGGMAEVNPQGLTLLAEVAIPVEEVTSDVMARQIASAEEDLAAAKPGEAQRKATEVINQPKALQGSL